MIITIITQGVALWKSSFDIFSLTAVSDAIYMYIASFIMLNHNTKFYPQPQSILTLNCKIDTYPHLLVKSSITLYAWLPGLLFVSICLS